MKIFGLTLVMALAIGGAAMADTATVEVFQGWNFVSCPLAPLNLEVTPYDGFDYTEPYFAFDEVTDSLDNGRLIRFDAASGNQYKYLVDAEFGKLLLGDAYQLYIPAGVTSLSYDGIKNGIRAAESDPMTDMWISLPGLQGDGQDAGGWHMIGTPYATSFDIATVNPDESIRWTINFTDGNEMLDWPTAEGRGWVKDVMYGLNSAGQVRMGYNESTITMEPGTGYWIQTLKDNIAMVIDLP